MENELRYAPWIKGGQANRTVERNVHPVIILNIFSKIYGKILKNQFITYLDETLSLFIAAYRKAYGTQNVLMRMMEEWRVKLDNDNIVGAIFMNLSKAFHCIPHDLLIAKLHAYGFDENDLVLIYSYLKRRKQSVRINNTYSFPKNFIRDTSRLCFGSYSFQYLHKWSVFVY